jgi:hypothetical protein
MAHAIRCWPPTAEAWEQSWVSPCGICGGQSGNETGPPPPPTKYFGFPLSISFHWCSTNRKRIKNNHQLHLHHRVAQEALRQVQKSINSMNCNICVFVHSNVHRLNRQDSTAVPVHLGTYSAVFLRLSHTLKYTMTTSKFLTSPKQAPSHLT